MSRDGVRFTDVQRTYRSTAGSVEALHAAGGAFPPGAIGALVGPSGSGKSTLLRILGGIDAADAGEVVVDGVDVRRLRGAALRRFRRGSVTFLAQRAAANLIPQLTLRDQLGAGGGAQAERVGLAHRLDAVASALSGGEQARAALAVGLREVDVAPDPRRHRRGRRRHGHRRRDGRSAPPRRRASPLPA